MNYKNNMLRIIDANINRAKEGARVCEDIMRLVVEDKNNTLKLKKIRHAISHITKSSKIKQMDIIQQRNSSSDICKKSRMQTFKERIPDVFMANSQRIKEALRVLEELFCIFDNASSKKFQNLRFKFYDVEKDCLKKLNIFETIDKNLPNERN
ncbi:MAG: hypothetical protein ABIA97_04835 [Candidatus Omnitrophota bacterium]